MVHTYYLIIIILTSITSSMVTFYLPTLKRVFKRLLTRKPKKTTIPAVNQICIDLNARVTQLEKQVNRRGKNYRQSVREEVKLYLEQLKK